MQMQAKDSLLTTKIEPPQIGVEIIWRERLIKKFDGFKVKKLTIVSAPTGYGKTVLISQFATKVDRPVVWYQLDEFDNELITFIRYFIASISRNISHFGVQALNFVAQYKDVSTQIRSIVVLIVNELEERAKEGLVVILDDYHFINEISIHKFIEELIQYLPKGVHLVISSRYVLPMNLARLKAHGLVNEITCNDLKFSRAETSKLANYHKDNIISKDIIEKAQIETDGWAVALSFLKTLFFQMEEDKRDLSLIQWKNREKVYKYFEEEVFCHLPERLQAFLINTSILDVITPTICNDLIEEKDTKEILENLKHQNIFLTKIEGKEDTYRYQHLFQDFLKKRLNRKNTKILGIEQLATSEGKMKDDVRIKVYCFGTFKVFGKNDVKPVQWKTTKAKEVFAYLIKNSNKIISKEKILEDIWPDMDPKKTSTWLHTYIYQIRKVMKKLGIKKGLIYKNGGYSLKRKGIKIDINEFENLFNYSMIEGIINPIEYLEKAISLYGGEYLEGLDNEWIVKENNRLQYIYIYALERLAKLHMEEKEYTDAINYLNIILEKNPLLEKAHKMLIVIFERIGDRIAAINHYENYCRILKNELGIEPRKEMESLYYNLIKNNDNK